MVQTRSLIIYGPHLFPTKLKELLEGLSPISQSAVVVPTAFLSFDIPGIPFLEPCHANCLVRGYNDSEAPQRKSEAEKGDGHEESEDYKRWVWAKCSTGADYEGCLPHPLEGIVVELDLEGFDLLLDKILSRSPATRFSLCPVEYVPFENGDPDRPTSSSNQRAEILVFDSPSRATLDRIGPLQPTQQYLSLILRGAFFTPLSRTYLSHLFLLRPYAPSTRFSTRIVRTLIKLALVPEFLLVWIPRTLLQSRLLRNTRNRIGMVGFGHERVWDTFERFVSRWAGSGWRN
ncbi:uncharacterized protein JCM15063_003181 [Sporobolomyces koalae]|uniref:uncharacterized protein n=1 Tax=Sporobolomyces koalae TaxID=500713 RepID=UPI0031783600